MTRYEVELADEEARAALEAWGDRRLEGGTLTHVVRAAFPYDPATWTEHAACSRVGTEMFFPGIGEGTRDAKTICAGCPVITECLDYAIRHNERFGVWGGMSTNERDEIQRRRAS